MNNELQAYTDRKDNLLIKDGNLIIRGIKENYGKTIKNKLNKSNSFNFSSK